MAENLNNNGLAPDNVDISQYQLNNPAISDSEHRAENNTSTISNPAISDSEFLLLSSRAKLSNAGLIIGESAGENISMFL